jgi:hypothetical protein
MVHPFHKIFSPDEIITRSGDDAAIAVLDAAEAIEAGLIVLATRGRAGLSRLLQGSVTDQVVRDSLCSVLTIRVSAYNLDPCCWGGRDSLSPPFITFVGWWLIPLGAKT